jgi:hypothetical protein
LIMERVRMTRSRSKVADIFVALRFTTRLRAFLASRARAARGCDLPFAGPSSTLPSRLRRTARRAGSRTSDQAHHRSPRRSCAAWKDIGLILDLGNRGLLDLQKSGKVGLGLAGGLPTRREAFDFVLQTAISGIDPRTPPLGEGGDDFVDRSTRGSSSRDGSLFNRSKWAVKRLSASR